MDKTRTAVEIFDQCAKAYQDKYMDLDLYHDSFDLFCASVDRKDAEVLDIACGPGNITRYLLKKRSDFRILGVDLSSNMIGLAKTNNPAAEFQIMDCREIEKVSKTFDAVICGFGLPYLSKEEALKLIKDVSGLLRPNGIFYVSTMEGDYEKSGYKASSSGGPQKLFIYYHQADYLTEGLRGNGFEIIDVSRKDYLQPDGPPITDLLIVARQVGEGWSPDPI